MEEESSSAILAPPELLAPRYALRVAGTSALGTRHEHNEDRFALERTPTGGALLVVCDGMGGMGRGDEASQLAVHRLTEHLLRGTTHPLDAASNVIHQVDRELVATFEVDKSGRRPGTTCAIVQIEAGVAYVSWVGDSSVLIVREGRAVARTRPHRVVQDMIDAGAMSPEEARTSPMARYLARSLGGRGEHEPVVEPSMMRPWRLVGGDMIVVCSDGLTDFLTDDEIARLVTEADDEQAACDALVSLALARETDDNTTVIVGSCVSVAPGEGEEGGEGWFAPPWEHIPEFDEGDEPDYHSDIRVADLPPDPAPPKGPVHPLMIAGVMFGFGVVALALFLVVWFALL